MIKLLRIINKLIAFLVVGALALMTILVFLNVVLRYTMNSGITVTEELSRILFVWVTFLGAVLAFSSDEHVTVNFLVLKLPPRLCVYWSLVIDLILFGCSILLFVGCQHLIVQNMSNHMPITNIPTGINYLAAGIMAVLLCLILAVRFGVKVIAIYRGQLK